MTYQPTPTDTYTEQDGTDMIRYQIHLTNS